MSTQLKLTVLADARFEVKGSVWAGRLLRAGMYSSLREIRRSVSASTRKLIEVPPSKSDWVPGQAIIEVDAALFDLGGAEVCARCARETSHSEGITSVGQKLAESLLKMFGATPHTLFARMPQLSASHVRGLEYEYQATGPRAGRMQVCYSESKDLPYAVFVALAGGLGAIFTFMGIQGLVSAPDVSESPHGNSATVLLRW